MSILNQPLSQIFIKPLRQIGEIVVNVIISESTNDTLTITKQPVQQGASIADHAFKEPTVLQMSAYFNDNNFIGITGRASQSNRLAVIYEQLLKLQSSREPFSVVTPKRIYKSMLISSLGLTTDKNTENILALQLAFQEVIIVSVSTVQVPPSRQRSPESTAKTENTGRQSAIVTGVQAGRALLGL